MPRARPRGQVPPALRPQPRWDGAARKAADNSNSSSNNSNSNRSSARSAAGQRVGRARGAVREARALETAALRQDEGPDLMDLTGSAMHSTRRTSTSSQDQPLGSTEFPVTFFSITITKLKAECLQGRMMHTTFSAGRFKHGKNLITLKDMIHNVWSFYGQQLAPLPLWPVQRTRRCGARQPQQNRRWSPSHEDARPQWGAGAGGR